ELAHLHPFVRRLPGSTRHHRRAARDRDDVLPQGHHRDTRPRAAEARLAGCSHRTLTMTALLATSGLTKHFGGVIASDHVSLEINEGELRGIIGPNGAG